MLESQRAPGPGLASKHPGRRADCIACFTLHLNLVRVLLASVPVS